MLHYSKLGQRFIQPSADHRYGLVLILQCPMQGKSFSQPRNLKSLLSGPKQGWVHADTVACHRCPFSPTNLGLGHDH